MRHRTSPPVPWSSSVPAALFGGVEWLRQYTDLLGTKRGLVPALHSGDPAYATLSGRFLDRVGPVLAALLGTAAADGTVRDDVSARDLLYAVANLQMPVPGEGPAYNHRMVALLIDGLRTPRRDVPRHRSR